MLSTYSSFSIFSFLLKSVLRKPLCLLFVLVSFIASCDGQTMPKSQGTAKIIAPPGTDPYASFRCSIMDKAGNLWFGTTGAGIYRYNGKSFVNFTEKDGLGSLVIYTLLEDKDGTIWVGTEKGVFRSKGNTFSRFVLPGDDAAKSFSFPGTGSPANRVITRYTHMVYCIIQDKTGHIWFATERNGLCRFDGKAFTHFMYINDNWVAIAGDKFKNDSKVNDKMIQFLLEDKQGNIWFSTFPGGSGVYRFDGRSFSHFNLPKQTSGHIFSMINDKAGNIWFATRDDGVYRYDGKSFTGFDDSDGLCNKRTYGLLADKAGHIWISSLGTLGVGGCISIYDGKDFTTLSMKGITNSGTWTMVKDKQDYVWIGTRQMGLYRYEGKYFTDFSEHGDTP
jgi:ligand-binding sensor domain-containing protein